MKELKDNKIYKIIEDKSISWEEKYNEIDNIIKRDGNDSILGEDENGNNLLHILIFECDYRNIFNQEIDQNIIKIINEIAKADKDKELQSRGNFTADYTFALHTQKPNNPIAFALFMKINSTELIEALMDNGSSINSLVYEDDKLIDLLSYSIDTDQIEIAKLLCKKLKISPINMEILFSKKIGSNETLVKLLKDENITIKKAIDIYSQRKYIPRNIQQNIYRNIYKDQFILDYHTKTTKEADEIKKIFSTERYHEIDRAIYNNDIEALQDILDRGFYFQDSYNFLLRALQDKKNEIVEILADNIVSKTALEYAIEHSDFEIVKSLIGKTITANQGKDLYGTSELIEKAIKFNKIEILDLLIEKYFIYSEIELPVIESLFQYIIQNFQPDSNFSAKEMLLNNLIERTLNICKEDQSQILDKALSSAILWDIAYGNNNLTQLFLDKKSTIGHSSLSQAIQLGNIEIVKLALEQNIDLASKENKENKYIINAFEQVINNRDNSVQILKLLLGKNANVNLKDILSYNINAGSNKLETIGIILDTIVTYFKYVIIDPAIELLSSTISSSIDSAKELFTDTSEKISSATKKAVKKFNSDGYESRKKEEGIGNKSIPEAVRKEARKEGKKLRQIEKEPNSKQTLLNPKGKGKSDSKIGKS